MATFIALVLVMVAMQVGFVAVKRHGEHAQPWRSTAYRHSFFFRTDRHAGSVNYIDRDAERAYADVLAMSHRAPHS